MAFDLGVLVTLLTVISSVAAFFYKKDGALNQIGGLGYVLLLILLTIGGTNVYSAFLSASNADVAKIRQEQLVRENEMLVEENRRANTAMQMVYIDQTSPFTATQVSFSSYNSQDLNPDVVPSPLGENYVLIPNQIGENRSARVWIDIYDFTSFGAKFTDRPSGGLNVEQGITSEIEPKASYPLNVFDACNSETWPDCMADARAFFFESLAAADGDSHFFIDLQSASSIPALETMSRILQNPYIGGAVFPIISEDLDPSILEEYFDTYVNSEIYFMQDYPKTSPLKGCRRTARLPIDISVVREFPIGVDEKCPEKSICLIFSHSSNLNVNSCQVSEI